MNKQKKAQQEIIGFVLIVSVVVVGIMIFLILSLKNSPEEVTSLKAENLLTSLMRYTSSCALVFEPQYETIENLFKSCYKEKRCSNQGVSACEFLNSSLEEITSTLVESEASVASYQIDFVRRNGPSEEGLLQIIKGDCKSQIFSGAQKSLVSGSESLLVRLKLCESL